MFIFKKFKYFVLVLTSIVFFNWISVFALNSLEIMFLDLNINSLLDNFSDIHFMAWWNNFLWWVFWLPNISLPRTKEIHLSWNTNIVHCHKKLRWIYYNEALWENIFPLDHTTLESLKNSDIIFSWMSITWWLYTSCDENPFWIYWQVGFFITWDINLSWYVTAWIKLDYTSNRLFPFFSKSFEYFNNQKPVWYIVDSVSWIWFVWWILTWHNCTICKLNWWNCDSICWNYCTWDSINTLFQLSWNILLWKSWCNISYSTSWWNVDVQWWIKIQWKIWLTKSLSQIQKQTLLWNITDKISIVWSPNFSSSNLIDDIRKKFYKLCRGTKTYWEVTELPENYDNDVICIKYQNYNSWNNITIDLKNDIQKFKNKNICVYNANVILKNSMTKSASELNLFIDKWNLLLENINNSWNLQFFNSKWYPENNTWVVKWVFIKWNIIINWLIAWYSWWKISTFNNKLFLHWKITSLNTMWNSSDWRKSQLENLFWTNNFNKRISLQNVFKWECNISWIWTDWVNCKNDNFYWNPLVIIDTTSNNFF